jgi:outer membrane autotransporter protein
MMNWQPRYPRSAARLVWLALCFSASAVFAEPWQNLTQPIGNLLIDPPQSALTVNRYLMSLDPNITPATFPFELSTDVTKIQTTQTLYFVRVYNESSGSFPVGSWIMRASEARGLNAAQIRNIQALPAEPTDFTFVEVPAGIILYTGLAGPIEGWGQGGATQSKMMGPPFVPRENYMNRQPLGDCFLCYEVLAPTGNAARVASVLDRTTPIAYTGLDNLYNNLDSMYFGPTATQFRAALNALSGEGVVGSQTVALGNTTSFVQAVSQDAERWIARGASTSQSTSALTNPANSNNSPNPTNGLWASLTGGTSTLRGSQDTATVQSSGAGLQIGMRRQLSPNHLVGIALGATNSNYSVNARATHGTLNGFNAALYGVASFDRAYLLGTLAYTRSNTDLDRTVSVQTLYNQQKASFATNVVSLRLEAGYRLPLGEGGSHTNLNHVNLNNARPDTRPFSFDLTPFVAVEPTVLWQNAFTERMSSPQSNATNLGLSFQAQQITSLPVTLGIQIDSTVNSRQGWLVRPWARLAWVHEFNPTRQLDASLQLLPGQTFTVYGASAPRNLGKASLGIAGTSAEGLTAYLTIDTAFSSTSQAFAARAGINLSF